MVDFYANSYDGSQTQMVPYPFILQAAGGDAAIMYAAQDIREVITALWPGAPGIVSPGDFHLAQRGAGANFSVDISAGRGILKGTTSTEQGAALCRSTATTNLTTPGAPGSGTAHHRVVAELLDKQAAGSLYGWRFHLVADTGGGLPAQPASSFTLGTVNIPSGAGSVTNAMITNQGDAGAVGPFIPYFGEAYFNSSSVSLLTGNTQASGGWIASDDPYGMWTTGTPAFFTVPATGRWDVLYECFVGDTNGTLIQSKVTRNGTADSNLIAGDTKTIVVNATNLRALRRINLTVGDRLYFVNYVSANSTLYSSYLGSAMISRMQLSWYGPAS